MTPSQTIGPFYHFSLTADESLGCMARDGIRVRFRLLDGDGAAVPDGMIEIWQADASGRYDAEAFCGFGRMATDQNGCCVFETLYPGRVELQAPHLNVSVFARGLLGRLCTRVYFDGDPALGEDAVLGMVPEDRRGTLIARRDEDGWIFEIRLQGDRETVFFDI
jgi:protocatechuate 3,4-dioxygenase, alpha subunit